MKMAAADGRGFAPHCMIKYAERVSGEIFMTPICYMNVGGEVVICASKGGADHHRDRYLNLIARPVVEFQVANQAWRSTWREPTGTHMNPQEPNGRRSVHQLCGLSNDGLFCNCWTSADRNGPNWC